MPHAMLPPPYRRHALARLDQLIALAEEDLARRAGAARRRAAARSEGATTAAAVAGPRLRLSERRLALLRRSRELLLAGEPSPGAGGGRRH